MYGITKLAVAVTADTAQELHEQDTALHTMLLEREAHKKVKAVTTPDEKYVVYVWDHEHIDTAAYVLMLEFLKTRRHALVEIQDDGSIKTEFVSDDEYGCDEEFNEILGVKSEITLWNDDSLVLV